VGVRRLILFDVISFGSRTSVWSQLNTDRTLSNGTEDVASKVSLRSIDNTGIHRNLIDYFLQPVRLGAETLV
jgi:hypothetical protein